MSYHYHLHRKCRLLLGFGFGFGRLLMLILDLLTYLYFILFGLRFLVLFLVVIFFLFRLWYAFHLVRDCERTQLKLIHQLFYCHLMMFLFGAKASDSKKYIVLSQHQEIWNERKKHYNFSLFHWYWVRAFYVGSVYRPLGRFFFVPNSPEVECIFQV